MRTCAIVVGLCVATVAQAEPYRGDRFTIDLPDGYRPVEAARRTGPQPRMAWQSPADSLVPAAITLQQVTADSGGAPALCLFAGFSFAGPGGRLTGAAFVRGPTDKVCQLRYVRDGVAAVFTELHRPGETWALTCEHADGDAAAESACLGALATFRFRADNAPVVGTVAGAADRADVDRANAWLTGLLAVPNALILDPLALMLPRR